MIDPRLIAKAYAPQLNWSALERSRLANRITEDFHAAMSDHDSRMRRFQRYYQHWRGRSDVPMLGEEAESNYRVPITQWQTYSKVSKEMGALFGDDADIVAKPIGPTDQQKVRKISRFMTWRVFDSMRLPNKAMTFIFRKILFGRSHAYAPWLRDTFEVPLQDGTMAEEVDYEGPGFEALWPDDLVVPAEDVNSIQEFSWVIRKYRASPDELLRGEESGLYQGIEENWDKIVTFASHKRNRDFESELVKREKDLAEGVTYEGNLSSRNTLLIHEWYGKWRPLKGKQDGAEGNYSRREKFERDIVVRYIPELHMIVGIQDLAQMYPRMRARRPFVESSLVKDGSYWSPGFGELLETIEEEMTVNHNLATDAGQISVGPVIFYRPGAGFDPQAMRYAPRMAIPCEDPNSVKVLELGANLQFATEKEQTMTSYAERVTGITDMTMGRSLDRPNAPRTARQTLALLSEGDVRASLDTNVLREDMGAILSRFWEMETMFAPEAVWFRVTEDDADGLFDVHDGGAFMSADERGGRYDFDIRFADNVWSKQAAEEKQLQLYQIDINNPLIAQNPRALWMVTNKLHEAFGDDEFKQLVPAPPDPGLPVDPKDEWTRILQGETIHVHPMDNDQQHLADHLKRLQQAMNPPPGPDGQPDSYGAAPPEAIAAMKLHIAEHVAQIQQKQLLAQVASMAAAQAQSAMAQPPGGQHLIPGMIPPGLAGAPPQGAPPPMPGAPPAPGASPQPGAPQQALPQPPGTPPPVAGGA